jgi:UDP-N-acetyl-D-mannosaminuronic acid dehydrogenase
MKRVCCVGLGYIGLPTALIAAQHGHQVIGYDIDQDRVERINRGDLIIQEPGLKEHLDNARASGLLHAVSSPTTADYFIIAVPTPFDENKKADLHAVWSAVERIAHVLTAGNTVIIESTIPVHTTHAVAHWLSQQTGLQLGTELFVAHCPERVLPGNIMYELVHNARIIGGVDRTSVEKAANFYRTFVKGPLYLTTARAAEMVKLVENSYRDVAIAFANQVAAMATAAELNPFEIIELANKHPRVKILQPSCGVGGHCIAVDPWFLVHGFPLQSALLQTARMINDAKPHTVVSSIRQWVQEWYERETRKPTILLLGATYKADVDDLRESPALDIALQLTAQTDIHTVVCEPHVSVKQLPTQIQTKMVDYAQGLAVADLVSILVPHSQFVKPASLTSTVSIMDWCGRWYTPKAAATAQEYLFWPASSTVLDSVSAPPSPAIMPLENY